MTKSQILSFFFKPGIKTQNEAWDIFHYFKIQVLHQESPPQNRNILLLDFRIPLTRYYGQSSYMNKVTLRLHARNEEGANKIDDLLNNGVPPLGDYIFTLDRRNPRVNNKPRRVNDLK